MSQNKKQSSIYLITGDDDYLVDQKARSIVDQCCPEEERALGLEIVDGDVELVDEATAALGATWEALQTVGFFGGRKLVWLRRAVMFGDSRVGLAESVKVGIKELTNLINTGLPDGHQLIVSAMKVDGRSAFYKACKAAGELIDLRPTGKPSDVERAIAGQVSEMWKEQGLKPGGRDVLDAFVQIVGSDMRRLRSETAKLVDFLGNEKRAVRAEDIAAVVSAGRDSIAWTLQDQIGARAGGAAVQTLRQLLFQGENPIGLIFAIESRIRELLLLRECMRRKWLRYTGRGQPAWNVGPDEAKRLASLPKDPQKIHPFRAGKLLDQANRYSFRELLRVHRDVVETHEKLVSSSLPNELELEMMILRVTGVKVA